MIKTRNHTFVKHYTDIKKHRDHFDHGVFAVTYQI